MYVSVSSRYPQRLCSFIHNKLRTCYLVWLTAEPEPVAVYLMTTQRTVLSGLPFDLNPTLGTYRDALHPDVWLDLLALGNEMFGALQPIENSSITTTLRAQGLLPNDPNNPGQTLPYDGRYRGDWFRTNDFFMRDASHGQDGKNIESEVCVP